MPKNGGLDLLDSKDASKLKDDILKAAPNMVLNRLKKIVSKIADVSDVCRIHIVTSVTACASSSWR